MLGRVRLVSYGLLGRRSVLLSPKTSSSNRHPLLEIQGSWIVGHAFGFLALEDSSLSIRGGLGWKVSLNFLSLSRRSFREEEGRE